MQEVEQRREQLPEEHEAKTRPVLFAFLRVLRAFVVNSILGFSVNVSCSGVAPSPAMIVNRILQDKGVFLIRNYPAKSC
jgi:hypothetical protein